MKSIVLLLFYLGSIFVVMGYMNQKQKILEETARVQYRYVPGELQDQYENRGNLYQDMFKSQDPWLYGLTDMKQGPERMVSPPR